MSATLCERPAVSPSSTSIRYLINALGNRVHFDFAMLLSTTPSGGLQIVQHAALPEGFAKNYSEKYFAQDYTAWNAILEDTALIESATATPEASFMGDCGIMDVAVVPVESPLLPGYPGVLWLARTKGFFLDPDRKFIANTAVEIEKLTAARRTIYPDWVQTMPNKLFIFDDSGNRIYPTDSMNVSASLVAELKQCAKQILSGQTGRIPIPANGKQVKLLDDNGEKWHFRFTRYNAATLPALTQKPVVFFTLQPSPNDWLNNHRSDLASDQQICHLFPALEFLTDNYLDTDLQRLAEKMKCSPFHLHRIFSATFGITPHDYVTARQVYAAKTEILKGGLNLKEIAVKCGFTHQSHFASRFKQETGLTPTRWRRLVQRLHQKIA